MIDTTNKIRTALSVVGARPQFVKLQPVDQALRAGGWQHIIVHTGQHYDAQLSQTFFDELNIPKPSVNLEVGSGSHGYQAGKVLEMLDTLLQERCPDVVIVYGDTNATVAGALAAVKLHIPVAHIEAGMRSFNREMPEEINRVITDHIANFHFCTNEEAKANLQREGIKDNIFVVGDVMIDVLRLMLPKAEMLPTAASSLGLQPKSYALATIHRPSNTDEHGHFKTLLQNLTSLPLPVILPGHPRFLDRLKRYKLRAILQNSSVHLIPPAGYLEMLALEKDAKVIITDSGGIQKEAYHLGVPCLTLRTETEWKETVLNGWNTLIDITTTPLVDALASIQPPSSRPNIFGNGDAAQNIVRHLKERL